MSTLSTQRRVCSATAPGKTRKAKSSKKAKKGQDVGVEDILLLEAVTYLAVEGPEAAGQQQHEAGLDGWYDLGAGAPHGHQQHILCVAEDGLVGEDAELLTLHRQWDPGLHLWRRWTVGQMCV